MTKKSHYNAQGARHAPDLAGLLFQKRLHTGRQEPCGEEQHHDQADLEQEFRMAQVFDSDFPVLECLRL
jgi:hypothetical protein